MEKMMGLRHLKKVFSIILKSSTAAIVAGATMAVLNVALEIVKGESLFRFHQIYPISLWHILIWLVFGILMGLIYSIIFLLKKSVMLNNQVLMIYFYVYIACWLLITGYINFHLLNEFSSIQSIIWNLVLIITGLFLPILILNKIDATKIKKFPIVLKLHLLILVIFILFSAGLNSDFLFDRSKSGIVDDSHMVTHFNVLMIILDAVRADHLSCYGYDRKTSPNIDQLASNGVLFENAFSNSSHTAESVPSLLGSVYSSSHNVRSGWLGSLTTSIPKDLILLPSIFKSNGYNTAFFSMGAPISSKFGYDRDIDDYYEPQKFIITETVLARALNKIFKKEPLRVLLYSSYSMAESKYNLKSIAPEYVNQKVISWISANRDNPFFMYLHLSGGHESYDPPEEYRRLFDSKDVPNLIKRHPERINSMFPLVKQASISELELNNMIALYDAEIFYHDKYVGELVDYLKTANLINNTIIIFTADHGEEFYDHFGWGHIYSLFDELIHIPIIFYCPRLIPKGKRQSELFSHVDVLPTILALCGISGTFNPSYEIEGIDYSALILSENHTKIREHIFSEVNIDDNLCATGLRTNASKAIQIRSGQDIKKMFFNLSDDPLEKNNIYNGEDPNIFKVFNTLDLIQRNAKEKSFKADKIDLDEKTKEQLRALGYIK